MRRIIYLLLLLLPGACNKSDFGDGILSQQPENSVASSNFWQTEEDMQSASFELHARLRACFSHVSRRIYRDRGLPFDYLGNLWKNISNNELEKSWNIQNANLSWRLEYDVISQANQILEFVGQADISQERKDFFRGEALTLRAWTYFYILRTWGDAPLLTGAFDSGMKGATPWQEIAHFIIADLREAAKLLPPAVELNNKQIPSCGTANAILAHVCAWTGSLNHEPELLEEGIRVATEVIKSGDYRLLDSPAEVCKKVFKGNSEEGIFELQFYDNELEMNRVGGALAYVFEAYPCVPRSTPGTKRRNLRFSNEKVKEFFNTCGTWFGEIIYQYEEMAALPAATNQGAAYFWKYRDFLVYESGSSVGLARALNQNEILIRLADIILLRAEMRARTRDEQGAIDDLNVIRQRCQATLYSAGEGGLLEAIFHQREQELFCEGINTRFFDIVRNGMDFIHAKLNGRFKQVKNLYEIFLPYHSAAFNLNPALKQNPEWQKYIQYRR